MLLSALFALAMAAQPAPPAEMLGVDTPDQFKVGSHQRSAMGEITELVQPPETVDRWSKLVTNLRFFGAAKFGLDAYDAHWRDSMRTGCPGVTDTIVRGKVDGRPALRHTFACPKNPLTGKPENLSAVIVQGEANMMMVQVAFRRPLTPADTALAEHVIGSLKLCEESALDTCVARKATGFQADPTQ